MAHSKLSISALIDSQPASPRPQVGSLPSLAEVTAGLSSPKHRQVSLEALNRPHDHPSYYPAPSAGYGYPPSASSPHTPYGPGYPPSSRPYPYPPSHASAYPHDTASGYPSAPYDAVRPYSRHSAASHSSHSRSPELQTSLSLTGMKRKRSDEGVLEPVLDRDRDRDRIRYPYSDTRETYEPAPPPPGLSPSHAHPISLPHAHSPRHTYVHPSVHDRLPDSSYYYSQSQSSHPQYAPLVSSSPHTPHTSTSAEFFPRQPAYGYPPSSYPYPPPHYPPPVERERISPHAEPHPAYPTYASHPAPVPYPPYRSPTTSYSFAPAPASSHSHHSHSPFDRPGSGSREPIIATPYAVPRTETSPVVDKVQRVEEERRLGSGSGSSSREGRVGTGTGKGAGTVKGSEMDVTGEEPNQLEDVDVMRDRRAEMKEQDEMKVEREPRAIKTEEGRMMEINHYQRRSSEPIKVETLAGAIVETCAPAEILTPANAKPELVVMDYGAEPSKPKLAVEVNVESQQGDMDLDIVSSSPAATISVAHRTPIEARLPAADRSPSLASTIPLQPEIVEPSPAPTVLRTSIAPDVGSSPAPTILRIASVDIADPSPAPTVLHEEAKVEPASPVLNVDSISPPVPSGIRESSTLLPATDVVVPQSTQLAALVDAALGAGSNASQPAAANDDTPLATLNADMEVDVVDVQESPADAARDQSVFSESTSTALEKASAARSKSHSSKSKSKSHKAATATTATTASKSKSKAKEPAPKTAVAKEKESARPLAKDASPVLAPANKSKSKKSHHKQIARLKSPELGEDTPEPDKAVEEEEEKDDRLYCMCETPYDEERFMIGCDKCDNWYHPGCVGLEEESVDLIDKFFCPRCTGSDANLSTTSKAPCARYPLCTGAARLPLSKYCSDECGRVRVEELYNMQPPAVQALVRMAVKGAKRPEGRVDIVTGRVDGRNRGEDAQLDMLEESLQRVLDERAESEHRLELWDRRERVVDAIVGRWREEHKEEGLCGYDERLGWGWDEMDGMEAADGVQVCQEGLKCDRHRGWQSAHTDGVQRAKSLENEHLLELAARERSLRREMGVVEERKKEVQRVWRKVPDVINGDTLAETAEAPDVIDVKVEA